MITIKYGTESLTSYPEHAYLLFNNEPAPSFHRMYVNPNTNNEKQTLNWVGHDFGYNIITKIVKEKDMKDVILNLRHENSDVRMLCEEIISNGFESIIVI